VGLVDPTGLEAWWDDMLKGIEDTVRKISEVAAEAAREYRRIEQFAKRDSCTVNEYVDMAGTLPTLTQRELLGNLMDENGLEFSDLGLGDEKSRYKEEFDTLHEYRKSITDPELYIEISSALYNQMGDVTNQKEDAFFEAVGLGLGWLNPSDEFAGWLYGGLKKVGVAWAVHNLSGTKTYPYLYEYDTNDMGLQERIMWVTEQRAWEDPRYQEYLKQQPPRY